MLTACGGGDAGSPGATVPHATSTTDPYAVPATIDIPYLNRVFVALEKINGDATRLIVANKRITPEAATLLQSILTPEEFKIQAGIWNDYIDQGLGEMPTSPGDRRTTVVELLRVGADCVALRVERDFNARRTQPIAPVPTRMSLRRDTKNVTRWVIAREGSQGDAACAG